jgi:hypothetical protein
MIAQLELRAPMKNVDFQTPPVGTRTPGSLDKPVGFDAILAHT